MNKIKNSQYLIAASLIRSFITLIAVYFLTNFYSKEDFAIYNITLSVGLLISSLASSTQIYLMTNFKNKKILENGSYYIVENLNLTLFICSFFFLIIYIFKDFFFFKWEVKLFFLSLFIGIIFILQIILQNLSRIVVNYKLYFKASVYDRIFFLITFLLSILFGIEIVITLFVYIILSLIYLLKNFFSKKLLLLNLNFIKNKELIKTTISAFFINLFTILIGLPALIIISSKMSELEITNSIALGTTILSLGTIPFAWIETILGPIISRIFATRNISLVKKLIRFNFKNIFLISFLLLTLILFFFHSNFFLFFLLGTYLAYKKIIFLICFLIPIVVARIYLSWFFLCIKKYAYINISYFILFLIFFNILNYLNFNIEKFLFYYIFFLIVESLALYVIFNSFYKILGEIVIYIIYLFTILTLLIYTFYSNYLIYILLFNMAFFFFYININEYKKLIKIFIRN